MNKWLKQIDRLIEKIPFYIKSLIQKMAIAIFALGCLVAVIMGIVKGIEDAKVSGFQSVEKSDDLFYLEKLREENKKQRKLVEDIEYDSFSETEKKLLYRKPKQNIKGHLQGEKDSFLLPDDPLRTKNEFPIINEEDDSIDLPDYSDFTGTSQKRENTENSFEMDIIKNKKKKKMNRPMDQLNFLE